MTRSKLLAALAAALVCLAAGGGFAANLVVNPGFEDGSDEFAHPYGWQFTGGPTPDSGVDTSSSSHGGLVTFYFVADEPSDRISQSLPTTSGGDYLVSFWLGNYGSGSDGIVVSWDATTLLSISPTTAEFPWTQYAYTVTAASASSVLAFEGFDVDAAIVLDDVSVTPIPEPLAGTLASLSILAIAIRRR